MSPNAVENLVEKLSCDFILADPEEPDSISGLLPVLKQIHSRLLKTGLKEKAKEIISAKKRIDAILKAGTDASQDQMDALGEWINRFSTDMARESFEAPTSPEEKEITPQQPAPEKSTLDELGELLNTFSIYIGAYCPGEIPDLGAMLKVTHELMEKSEGQQLEQFNDIVIRCRKYVECMTLERIDDTRPIEQGTNLLKSMLDHLRKEKKFDFDYTDVLEILDSGINLDAPAIDPPPDAFMAEAPGSGLQENGADEGPQDQTTPLSDEDIQIMADFISEAFENLESIEIRLIDLEQDPSNTDIINDIFRPFHTIKGVSGFLSLTKINKLSHTTENMLDSARSGEFLMDHTATDAVLESVDTLKLLLERLKEGLKQGLLLPDNDIFVTPLREKLESLQAALIKGEKPRLGKILVQKGDINEQDLDTALQIQKQEPEKKIGEILVREKKTGANQVSEALMDQKLVKKATQAQVKVSTEKLDDLVDYAGELVIAQSMLKQTASKDASLGQTIAQLGQIVSKMQTIAMSMRMIPIKATFMKMIRLVRDLSKKSGKLVRLEMSGEDTEIDRNVVDALYDPMVHMIRNAVDHGIEDSTTRKQEGKPEDGCIVLSAYHKGGNIIIEIEDDGKGLDKNTIFEKAVQRGLVSASDKLTDAQIFDLILQPGFSTAQTITDVSGRGVGMDVVKDGIEKFRGHLNISSQKGRGTRFTISLPLTLAIIDGMLVEVAGEHYVIPTTAIQKTFKPEESDCFTVEGKGEMVKDRGDLIPVVRLEEIYGKGSALKPIWDNLVVVVESKDIKKALLIDELKGKDEFVIKSLGGNLEHIEGIAGGAILSDGRVGLILDVHGIFELAAGGVRT